MQEGSAQFVVLFMLALVLLMTTIALCMYMCRALDRCATDDEHPTMKSFAKRLRHSMRTPSIANRQQRREKRSQIQNAFLDMEPGDTSNGHDSTATWINQTWTNNTDNFVCNSEVNNHQFTRTDIKKKSNNTSHHSDPTTTMSEVPVTQYKKKKEILQPVVNCDNTVFINQSTTITAPSENRDCDDTERNTNSNNQYACQMQQSSRQAPITPKYICNHDNDYVKYGPEYDTEETYLHAKHKRYKNHMPQYKPSDIHDYEIQYALRSYPGTSHAGLGRYGPNDKTELSQFNDRAGRKDLAQHHFSEKIKSNVQHSGVHRIGCSTISHTEFQKHISNIKSQEYCDQHSNPIMG